MEFTSLKYVYKASAKPDAYTLLLLHGTGGNENDLLPLADFFGPDVNVLSVRGNVSENGMPRFFKRLGMGIFDEKDLEFRTSELVHFLKQLSVEKGFDATKLIALGYSNGANIAGASLVLYPDFLAGAILLRPMQPFANKYPETLKKSHPVLITSGKLDPTVDPTATERYIEMLRNAKFDVSAYELPMGHNLSKSDMQLASDWFVENFKS